MGQMSDNHADYEQTLTRIATVLDVIAEEQLAQARSMTGLTELVGRAADGQGKLTSIVERLAERQDKLDQAMERLDIKGAVTLANLNALIELMDRHLREGDKQ
jgi:ABC-type transporter Mla subunit MlaD